LVVFSPAPTCKLWYGFYYGGGDGNPSAIHLDARHAFFSINHSPDCGVLNCLDISMDNIENEG
jgi:hypothetical protein